MLFHKTTGGQCIQVLGGRDARHLQVALQEVDLGIRVREQVVDQVLAIKLVLCPDAVLVVKQRRLDGVDGGQRLGGGLLHGVQHVQHPVFPVVIVTHGLQQVVIVGLGAHDVLAQVQHRYVEQPLFHQIQHIQDAPGAAVAVIKRVDAFKLVVRQRHLDQRVYRKHIGVVQKPLQVPHQRHNFRRILRRRVHSAPRAIFQRRARQFAKTRIVAFELALNLDDVVCRQQAAGAHLLKPDP